MVLVDMRLRLRPRMRSVVRHKLLDHSVSWTFIDDITSMLKVISMLFAGDDRFVNDHRVDHWLHKLLLVHRRNRMSDIFLLIRDVHWASLMRMTYIVDDLLMVTMVPVC